MIIRLARRSLAAVLGLHGLHGDHGKNLSCKEKHECDAPQEVYHCCPLAQSHGSGPYRCRFPRQCPVTAAL